MSEPKLPIHKKTLDILYHALSRYRGTGEYSLDEEQRIDFQNSIKKELDGSGDAVAQALALLSVPDSERRARIRAFQDVVADLDIIIAKVQVLRRKLEGQEDSLIIDNLLDELSEEN